MLIGYVRVSTNDQNTDLQRNALNCAGCELIFEDKISGTKSERPGLKKLLRTLSAGDTLVVWKLDRLGRIGGRKPKLTDEQWAQAGRLIAAGETRQRVALIYDVGVSTLYRKFPVGRD
ncbi:recombinase family protein [Salmonella enterica]|uniref:Helix-turn-helix domain-containing protein n=1 Tax=Salmonella enterica TaxID=28901 RepID=A0A630PW80_SALER|nr:recombinase family protein [Salmonella enterica]EDX7533605.1 recombinase family protein [Salmonella enterica subsp. enterica serovar Inverness]EAX2485363.1 recombinase family protein [Salmonella enterica]EAX3173484.1 recombinase family protein [Salmonella enterica]EAY8194517.1 recombinase family protein [Salmonella enterica]